MLLCHGKFRRRNKMSRIKRLIPLVLIMIATLIFISSTYIENIDRFSRITISVVANIIYFIAVILIIRRSFIKSNEKLKNK
jgi:hypothetical protein